MDGNPVASSHAQILRVLVIDDDPILRETLVEVFLGDGHQVVAADGGEHGIAAFAEAHRGQDPFELVVTDLEMPQIDGRQVAAAIKKICPAVPIILLTGRGQRMIAEGDRPEHIDCVLNKPPHLEELRQALVRLRHLGP